MNYRRLPYRSMIAALALSAAALAAPAVSSAETGALFSASDEASVLVVDHRRYSEFVEHVTVRERGRTLIAQEIAHRQARPFLADYVQYLSSIPVERLNRDEQLAYWLNTRNVLLFQAIAEESRIRDFKRKRGTPSEPGAWWTRARMTVGGQELSMQDIEENILFAGWDDPNIMFGLYQGIRGGPELPRSPFTGEHVKTQLAEAARAFASESANVRVRSNSVRISTYFDWYAPLAHEGDEAALREHIATIARPREQAQIREIDELDRRRLSTAFEQFRIRQPSLNTGGGGGGASGGYGS